MSLNRREMLRLGAAGAGGLLLSGAASSQSPAVNALARAAGPSTRWRRCRAAPASRRRRAGSTPPCFQRPRRRSIRALDSQPRFHRRRRFREGSARSALPRRRPAERPGRKLPRRPWPRLGSRPYAASSSMFSNQPGSEATSNGTYTTAETYQGKYGLSMKVQRPRLDQQQCRVAAPSSSTTPGMPSRR